MANVELTIFQSKVLPIKSYSPLVLNNKFKPNFIIHEWHILGSVAGDDTGGYVFAQLNFSTLFDNDLYHWLSKDYSTTTTTGAVQLQSHSDRWKSYSHPTFANDVINFHTASIVATGSVGNGISNQDQINKPVYMGQVSRDTDAGLCLYIFNTNTDAATYWLHLTGFSTTEPGPFPHGV